MNLQQHLLQELQAWDSRHAYFVAYSGGLDSTVLLHILISLKRSKPIIAIHVNHQLSPQADAWQIHCERFCEQLGVELKSETVNVESQGSGIESAARLERYKVFESIVKKDDILLLGHHLDDQVETMLYRLMRGTGPNGLAGITPLRHLGEGQLVRPLLSRTKIELEKYAHENNLSWIDDESNDDSKFDRNYLRNEVIPLLEKRWPKFSKRWLQTSESCREENVLCRVLAEEDIHRCDELPERWGVSVDFQSVSVMSIERRNNLLRTWIDKHRYSQLEKKHLVEIDKQFFNSESVKAEFTWGNACLRRYKQRLYLTPPDPDSTKQAWNGEPIAWDLQEPIVLSDGSRLAVSLPRAELNEENYQINVRWRTGNERCRPAGRGHSQSLKKLLQEYELEPWLRDRVPLIFYGDELIAVGDLWLCELETTQFDVERLGFHWTLGL